MARPTKSKEAKPKALEAVPDGDSKGGGSSSGGGMLNMIIMAVIIVVCTAVSSAASVYFLAPMVLKPLLAQMAPAAEGEEGEGGEAHGEEGHGEATPMVGPVLELEEFTVNLRDPDGQRYLRATLSLTVTADDPQFGKLSGEALHKWEENFHHEMGHYVPSIRDIVISTLTKKTAAELSTMQGKEQVKEEIKRQSEALLHGKHKVIRVNLENFIIQ